MCLWPTNVLPCCRSRDGRSSPAILRHHRRPSAVPGRRRIFSGGQATTTTTVVRQRRQLCGDNNKPCGLRAPPGERRWIEATPRRAGGRRRFRWSPGDTAGRPPLSRRRRPPTSPRRSIDVRTASGQSCSVLTLLISLAYLKSFNKIVVWGRFLPVLPARRYANAVLAMARYLCLCLSVCKKSDFYHIIWMYHGLSCFLEWRLFLSYAQPTLRCNELSVLPAVELCPNSALIKFCHARHVDHRNVLST